MKISLNKVLINVKVMRIFLMIHCRKLDGG